MSIRTSSSQTSKMFTVAPTPSGGRLGITLSTSNGHDLTSIRSPAPSNPPRVFVTELLIRGCLSVNYICKWQLPSVDGLQLLGRLSLLQRTSQGNLAHDLLQRYSQRGLAESDLALRRVPCNTVWGLLPGKLMGETSTHGGYSIVMFDCYRG